MPGEKRNGFDIDNQFPGTGLDASNTIQSEDDSEIDTGPLEIFDLHPEIGEVVMQHEEFPTFDDVDVEALVEENLIVAMRYLNEIFVDISMLDVSSQPKKEEVYRGIYSRPGIKELFSDTAVRTFFDLKKKINSETLPDLQLIDAVNTFFQSLPDLLGVGEHLQSEGLRNQKARESIEKRLGKSLEKNYPPVRVKGRGVRIHKNVLNFLDRAIVLQIEYQRTQNTPMLKEVIQSLEDPTDVSPENLQVQKDIAHKIVMGFLSNPQYADWFTFESEVLQAGEVSVDDRAHNILNEALALAGINSQQLGESPEWFNFILEKLKKVLEDSTQSQARALAA